MWNLSARAAPARGSGAHSYSPAACFPSCLLCTACVCCDPVMCCWCTPSRDAYVPARVHTGGHTHTYRMRYRESALVKFVLVILEVWLHEQNCFFRGPKKVFLALFLTAPRWKRLSSLQGNVDESLGCAAQCRAGMLLRAGDRAVS